MAVLFCCIGIVNVKNCENQKRLYEKWLICVNLANILFKRMKRTYLSLLSLIIIALFQQCKKGTNNPAGTTPTTQLESIINGTTWLTDTVTAGITYTSATKTKVLTFTGTAKQNQISCTITLNNATSTNDFNLGTYSVNANNNPLMVYSIQKKDTNGNYVYTPVATAGQNEGQVTISSVTNGQITGTFNFTTRKINYDDNGNVISVTNTVIASGLITNMKYTFESK